MNQEETVKYLVDNYDTILPDERRRLVKTLDRRSHLKYVSMLDKISDHEINPKNIHIDIESSSCKTDIDQTVEEDYLKPDDGFEMESRCNTPEPQFDATFSKLMDAMCNLGNSTDTTATSTPSLQRGTALSAGHDICTPEGFTLNPGSYHNVDTGVKLNLEPDQFVTIHPRSGTGFRHQVEPFQGVIDADYSGNVIIQMRNGGIAPYTFIAGERIAQLILSRYEVFSNATIIDNSGNHVGFGSTGRS